MRAKEIYGGLIERWGKECNDKAWISSLKKDYNLNDEEWTSDCFFLITLSWGPWVVSRQMKVWSQIKSTFPEVIDDIRNANKSFNGFPFGWQNDRTVTISNYLKQNSKSFKDTIIDFQSRNGLEIRDYLAEISGAKQNKKTISCFVRDFLLKDTFPIDSRVNEMLSSLGFPNDEDLMVKLCEGDRISSRVLNRMLYMQYDECPSMPNNKCKKCKINNCCWYYILK